MSNSNPIGNPRVRPLPTGGRPSSRDVDRGEYRRFDDLARKLAQVPKKELDEQRGKGQRKG